MKTYTILNNMSSITTDMVIQVSASDTILVNRGWKDNVLCVMLVDFANKMNKDVFYQSNLDF